MEYFSLRHCPLPPSRSAIAVLLSGNFGHPQTQIAAPANHDCYSFLILLHHNGLGTNGSPYLTIRRRLQGVMAGND